MDIYQILTEYNNPWSSREIFCFSCIMVIAVIMMIYLLRKEKMNKLQAAAILAELVFLGIVFGSTVFTRTGSVRQYELIPFWSWSAILRYHDMELLKENLLNCILLLPMGAKVMTFECGIRFLTDYLEGDHYFKIHREDHNLDRCRTQFKLVADMEKKWDLMQKIVAKYQ